MVKNDGAFERICLADPLLMNHGFTVAGGKIKALTYRLVGEDAWIANCLPALANSTAFAESRPESMAEWNELR